MTTPLRAFAAAVALALLTTLAVPPAAAQQPRGTYRTEELVAQGHRFFGDVSEGLASIIERAVSQYGLPNGYVLGQEGSGAIIGGLRYGEGRLYTKNAGDHAVFWEGPSIGFDFGGTGDRVMMLVYNLPSVAAIYQRFPGVAGSAHVIAGFGMTVLSRNDIYVVPIVSGVGARLGVNFGYLKFTDHATWNPF
jgi:hypothetical protein